MAVPQYPHDGLEVAPSTDMQFFNNQPDLECSRLSTTSPVDQTNVEVQSSENDLKISSAANDARIGGLKRSIFWILISCIALIVVAASVGGGLAAASKKTTSLSNSVPLATGQLPASSTSSELLPTSASGTTKISTTITPTATSSTAAAAESSTSTTDCPGSNGASYTSYLKGDGPSTGALTFTKHCDFTIATPHNIAAMTIGTFDASIEACASINYFGNSSLCTSAVFTLEPLPNGHNCWVKDIADTVLPMTLGKNVSTALLV